MYHECMHAFIDFERPPIKMSGSVVVDGHAHPVIYYIAEWTLFSASWALAVAQKERGKYFLSVQVHNILKTGGAGC